MGLSNFPSPADGGVLPVLVMNTVISVALVKNMLRSVLQLIGLLSVSSENADEEFSSSGAPEGARSKRKISVVQFKLLFGSAGSGGKSSGGPIAEECSVCLCGFEGEEEVSELSCKHFFHKNCLEKWFLNRRSTCPLCRSEL